MARSAICCPRCGAIESPQSETCYRCGAALSSPARAVPEATAFLRREDLAVRALQLSYVVHYLAVIVLTVILGGTLLEAISPGKAFRESLYALGALFGRSVLVDGEWYRLATATFAHYGILHLVFNTMALGAVGPETEKNLGRARFLLAYFGGGLLANVATLAVNGEALFQVGASGAICALMGSLFTVARLRGGFYGEIVRRIVGRWIVMTLIFGFLVPGIDNVAHVGGMVAGAVITRLAGLKR